MQARFLGVMFSWKRMGLVEVGRGQEWRRHRFRVKQGMSSQRQGSGARRVAREPRAPSPPEFFVQRIYIVGRMRGEGFTY